MATGEPPALVMVSAEKPWVRGYGGRWIWTSENTNSKVPKVTRLPD